MQSLWHALARRKRTDDITSEKTKLNRVLTLCDLVALSVGTTLGLGVYVLAGAVAYEQAGPAVTLSFLVAAIASAFAGLCYAEFAARVPKAGSAYVYSYVTVGEFVAFTIGWNILLEYVIGSACVARGLSAYVDALFEKRMSTYLAEALPINVNFLGKYPDFLSFTLIMIIASLLAIGVRESSFLNIIFTSLNLCTIAVVVVAGAIKADPANWRIPAAVAAKHDAGKGGFMPYGIAGVLAGAAKCFYGFVGFDSVATTGEEARNPQRNIPLSILIALTIIFAAYFSISTVLTMMLPYYMQDPRAPFPHAFDVIGWVEVKWVVAIGAIFALFTCMLGAVFPIPRILYAMASDGVIYRGFKRINERTKTPLMATMLAGTVSGTMAMLFDLNQLIEMLSIGTMLAYTIVAISVLVLRYECDAVANSLETSHDGNGSCTCLGQLLNLNGLKQPTKLSSGIVKFAIVLYCVFAICICLVLHFSRNGELDSAEIALLGCAIAALLSVLLVIVRQPAAEVKAFFKVPLVPWIPCLSVQINMYLMFQLDVQTWIRFAIWGSIGYFIYFTYGIRKSREGILQAQEREEMRCNTHL